MTHNGPENILRPGRAIPGMAAPGIPNAEVLGFVTRNLTAIVRAVTQRMRQVGVPEDLIGIPGVPGVEEGAFARYPGPQGGGNIRPDHPNVLVGRWRAGINVDEAIFDSTFRAFEGRGARFAVSQTAADAYHEAWAKASVRTRLDAAIAHEYEELGAVATPHFQQHYGAGWAHYSAVKKAPETSLGVSESARELLRLHRRVMGLE
jgi:hypothetical protein